MCVNVDRNADILLESGDEVEALLRTHNTGHILDAERVTAHLLDLFAKGDKHLEVMDRTERIADTALRMTAGLDALVHRSLDVAQVVERVEDTDDIHAVLDALAHEAAHGIIRIMMVAEQILTAQQHLQLGIFHVRFDVAEPLPRVLVQISQTTVKCRTAPTFNGVVACLIHVIKNTLKVGKRHTGRDQRLLRIAQHGLGDVYLFHILPLLWQQSRPGSINALPVPTFLHKCIISRSESACNAFSR